MISAATVIYEIKRNICICPAGSEKRNEGGCTRSHRSSLCNAALLPPTFKKMMCIVTEEGKELSYWSNVCGMQLVLGSIFLQSLISGRCHLLLQWHVRYFVMAVHVVLLAGFWREGALVNRGQGHKGKWWLRCLEVEVLDQIAALQSTTTISQYINYLLVTRS